MLIERITGSTICRTTETAELVQVEGAGLPPVLAGRETPQIAERVSTFHGSIASIFESWVNRRKSEHTRRAYREDVMAFGRFMGWTWPNGVPRIQWRPRDLGT